MSEQREILFRGKRVNNKWVEGYYYAKPILELHFILSGEEQWEVDGKTVGQYTGLKDKNEVRIFEGDIVAVKHPHQKKHVPGVIEFGRYTDVDSLDNYDYIGWYIKVYGKCVSILQPCADGMEIEVIGNIHDNPELLEENR